MSVVKGHGLQWEGKTRDQWMYGSGITAGVGHCSCGGRSPELPTTAARQRWHKKHKQAILDAQKKANRA